MLQIRADQYERLERVALERQTRQTARRFAQEVEERDRDLATRTLQYSNGDDLEFLDRLLRLTNIEQYQKFLLFAFLQTGIDFFEQGDFRYILDHTLLSGNAKARHLALSGFAILQGERES